MAVVHIPAPMRELTGGRNEVTVPGETLGQVIENLEQEYPGLQARLVVGERLRGSLAVFVDDQLPTSGLRTRLQPDSRVYFAPAIAGGTDADF